MPAQKKIAFLAIFTTYLIWGLTIPIIKLALQGFPPFTLVFLRFTLAALLLAPIYFFDEIHKPLDKKDLPKLVIIAFFGPFLSNTLFYFGISKTAANNAAIIEALLPIAIILGAYFLLKEKLNFSSLFGILLAFIGVLIITAQPTMSSLGSVIKADPFGNLLILASVFSWAIFSLGSKELFAKYTYFTIIAFSFLVAIIFVFPLALLEFFILPTWVENLNPQSLASLGFIVIFSSVLAYLFYEWGLSKIESKISGAIAYVQPIFAIIAAYFILGEKITPFFLASTSLIFLGLFLTTRQFPQIHHQRHKI